MHPHRRAVLAMLALWVALVLVISVAMSGTASEEPDEAVSASAEPVVPLPSLEDLPTTTTTSTTTTSTTTTTTTTQPPTTTTLPQKPPAAPPVASPTTGGCGGWQPLVAAHFPAEQVSKACAVMRCETGGTYSPTIHNQSSSASGLFQFLDGTWRSTTGLAPPAANYSAETQIAAAAKLWSQSGWSPWSCA